MKDKCVILHNPRCSKSRAAMELLKEKNADPDVVFYLEGGLSMDLLEEVLKALDKKPREIVRIKEDEFKALNLDLDDDLAVKKAIIDHPKILERPIIVKGEKAVIGRPPEEALRLF